MIEGKVWNVYERLMIMCQTAVISNTVKRLGLLVSTLKLLYDDCRKSALCRVMHDEVERLGMNYSALYELNSDIVNYRIKAPLNAELQSMMSKAAKVLNRRQAENHPSLLEDERGAKVENPNASHPKHGS